MKIYNTVQELNQALDILYTEYRAKARPIEEMFSEVYERQMAACTSFDEQWEVYKNCPSKYLKRAYSFSRNDELFCIEDFVIHYDVFDNEIKESFTYCLHEWIDFEGEYISHEKIVDFFDSEPIEIEYRSEVLNKYIDVRVPDHIIMFWKKTLVENKTANIYVPRYY